MKKKIIPYAVVATMTFGSAGMTAQAIEPEEASGNFPGVVDWTEADWNLYLDENYGTSLDDYDTLSDLEADLGKPVDLSSLGNADRSDPNVLDIMERYNMTPEELVLFLDNYDNVEDIYFVGDLENALELEGFELVDDGGDTGDSVVEAPAPAVEEPEEPVTEEPASETEVPATDEEPEEGTEGTEEPESETEVPATDEEPEEGTNDSATEETPVYAFDPSQLEEVYLTPLGWTEDDFSTYVDDNFNMLLTDFDSFEELENTVGPVLTDDRLQDLLDSYGLTPEEYRLLLADYGEVPEDYHFVYEVEEALDYYTSEEVENGETDTETGAEMPETATNSMMMILVGFGAAAAGALMLFHRRPQGEK